HHPLFFLPRYGPPRSLHSFPTRRSSDLFFAVHPRTPIPAQRFPRNPGVVYARFQVAALRIPHARRVERCGHTDAREGAQGYGLQDRKSTRLNSSHVAISYAVFCLKKKKV